MAGLNTVYGPMDVKLNNDGESAVVRVPGLPGEAFDICGSMLQEVLHATHGNLALRRVICDAISRCLEDPSRDPKDLLKYDEVLVGLARTIQLSQHIQPPPTEHTLADFLGNSD